MSKKISCYFVFLICNFSVISLLQHRVQPLELLPVVNLPKVDHIAGVVEEPNVGSLLSLEHLVNHPVAIVLVKDYLPAVRAHD